MTLTEFLLARIAEDEDVARAACLRASTRYRPHPEITRWRYVEDEEVVFDYDFGDSWPHYVTMDNEGIHASVNEVTGRHIARHDPARVLAECETKRRIVDLCSDRVSHSAVGGRGCTECGVLSTLALPYADHPDYLQEWKP